MLSIEYNQQTVLITGGTRGIGETLAREVATTAHRLIITGTSEHAPAWIQEHPQRDRISYKPLNFLGSDWTSQIEAITAQYPEIDVCINNAGMAINADIREIKIEDLRAVLEVNLVGATMLTSRVARNMAERRYGRIVNVSSIYGQTSRPGRSSYSAAKTGLLGATRAAALDLAAVNVLVNAVCLGIVLTEMPRKILGEQGLKEISAQIPLGRGAETWEVIPHILLLASRLNTYMTGQTIAVDGGYLAF